MQVVVDGLLTHYEKSSLNAGALVVLVLPGWADTSRSWTVVQKQLAEKYEVIVLDIPGFGGSQMPPSAWGLDDYVNFISHFTDKLSLSNIYAVIGHSNGGAMAIRGIAANGLKPQKLVLLASAGIRNEGQTRKRGLAVIAKFGKVITAPLPKSTRNNLRKKLYSAAGSDMLVAEHMQETFKRVVSEDVQQDAVKITVPTLLVYGDEDTATPLSFGQKYNSLIGNSILQTVPGAGHFLHVENADTVTDSVMEFLK